MLDNYNVVYFTDLTEQIADWRFFSIIFTSIHHPRNPPRNARWWRCIWPSSTPSQYQYWELRIARQPMREGLQLK